jgi:glyoxylase-like metal-dependent hydrolase (beta-lactamase superfamily II)
MTEGLPAGVTVFERGWLSANNILFEDADATALIDSGYSAHAAQTVGLVHGTLGARPLDRLLNTHLHSDHCGGNAALQTAYPYLQTCIPPGQAAAVRQWDPVALTYEPTGQVCPRFAIDGVLSPGDEVRLAGMPWEVHAAPGHDPHSVIFFQPAGGILISADALWENGFGVVFPELEGTAAFDEVGATLDLIERLSPRLVVPGHGRVMAGHTLVTEALARARARLSNFIASPARHAQHAAKVLIKFKLLEWQRIPLSELTVWAGSTSYLSLVRARYFPGRSAGDWVAELVGELVRSHAATLSGDIVMNA